LTSRFFCGAIFFIVLFALGYLQLFANILRDPLPHQSLIGNSLLRRYFFARQEIERVKLDRYVPQFSLSLSRENVLFVPDEGMAQVSRSQPINVLRFFSTSPVSAAAQNR
jgi:hypothetical protein